MDEEPQICAIFGLFAQWWSAKGLPAADTFEGLWSGRIGDYDFAINAHQETIDSLPRHHLRIVHKDGFLPSLVNPIEGMVLEGTEDEILAALRTEIVEMGEIPHAV